MPDNKITQMTVADFAKKSNVSRFTIYNWIKDKRMPPYAKAVVICTHIIINVDRELWGR